jgi:hypothetical protein
MFCQVALHFERKPCRGGGPDRTSGLARVALNVVERRESEQGPKSWHSLGRMMLAHATTVPVL